MRIAMVEDEEKDRKHLSDVLCTYAERNGLALEIDAFSSGEDFWRAFEPQKYALVFLDNYIGTGLGIDLARKARALDPAVEFVFVSMSMEFAFLGYEVHALHYLLKPATMDEIDKVFARLPKNEPEPEDTMLEVVSDYRPMLVPAKSIRYIEVIDKVCIIHAAEDIKTYMPLGNLAELLPPDDFLRTHRSFVVALGSILSMGKNEFALKGGGTVPISQSYRSDCQRAYIEYLAGGKKRRSHGAKPKT
ncbi:MAG: response regulator transcription factor [Schwartzia sp.]|nr:response regulator transcription factor [Schwartzia sp. (in: firmicutes)]MBR1885166.1 response regulator transcription factor [Schwartzia sp. (in: firmicutes)]